MDLGYDLLITAFDNQQVWRVREIDIDEKNERAVILIHRSDTAAADQAISDLKSSYVSVVSKESHEGNAYSAHVVFSLKKSGMGYLMLMEEVPGIGVRHVMRLLKKGAAFAAQITTSPLRYPHPDGTKKTLKGKFQFEAVGHPSDNFVDKLNGGKLRVLELVKEAESTNYFDQQQATKVKRKIISLSLYKGFSGRLYDAVKAVCGKASSMEADKVRLSFVDSDDFHRSVELDPDTTGLIDDHRFVKKSIIKDFDVRLDTASMTVIEEVRDKMYDLI